MKILAEYNFKKEGNIENLYHILKSSLSKFHITEEIIGNGLNSGFRVDVIDYFLEEGKIRLLLDISLSDNLELLIPEKVIEVMIENVLDIRTIQNKKENWKISLELKKIFPIENNEVL